MRTDLTLSPESFRNVLGTLCQHCPTIVRDGDTYHHGGKLWTDDTTPRTDRPVRFVYVHRAGWYAGRGAVLGMVGTLWTHLRHS